MAQKKYSFNKILKEYNKKYERDYKLPPEAFNVTILHDTEINKFYVTYTDADGIKKNKKSLHNFIHHHISSRITWSIFEKIMLDKENKKLNLKIEIWPSNKIRYAYLYSNYFANDVGNLGKSCMRGKDMQKSLNFYIKNNVRVVVVIDDKNKIHARALLWDNVKTTRSKKVFAYLDRVYTRSDTLCSLFIDLAKENNWTYYEGLSAGNTKSGLYTDNLDIKGVCHLPYTDTFRHLYYKDGIVTSSTIPSKVKHKDYLVNLTTTGSGGYFPELDPDRTQEAFTGAFISKKDAIFVKRYEDNYDGYVLKKHIANINGAYYSTHDKEIVITIHKDYILTENSVNEVITNDIIDKTTAVFSGEYKGYIHKSNAVSIWDEIYHKKDTDVTYFRNKWYHISQCFINYDREKRNIALSKKKFHFWIENEVFVPYPEDFVVRKDGLIPKEHTIIAYDLTYNPMIDDIEYQEVYYANKDNFVQLITGELVVNSSQNKKYLKKFNNKWYIKQDFKLPDKKQLKFAFMDKEK